MVILSPTKSMMSTQKCLHLDEYHALLEGSGLSPSGWLVSSRRSVGGAGTSSWRGAA